MKNNLKRINVLLEMFPVDSFYTININQSGISLQGVYNSDILLLARKNKFIHGSLCDINGYVEMRRDNICITLT